MGTASTIGYYNREDGTVTATYCHYDGYLAGNGRTLITHYNTPDQARAVATAGYLSALSEDLERDLAEAVHTEDPIIYESVEEYLNSAFSYFGADYLYLFDGEIWFFASRSQRAFEEVEMNLRHAA